MSIETAPPIERLYVLLRADGLGAHQVSARAAEHLTTLGWRMEAETEDLPVWWFDFASHGSTAGESAYVGSLGRYLNSGSWPAGDEGAPDDLRRLGGDRVTEVAVVQLFAHEE